MPRQHIYRTQLNWTGNTGKGTASYRDYERSHELAAEGKTAIAGSSDPAFRGDRAKWNPEELLLASLSACHQLAYLHLCATGGVVVTAYEDRAEGTMQETPEGSGHFVSVILRPKVTIAPGSDSEKAQTLHHRAHELCFIANSVNFTVDCEPSVAVESAA